MNVVLTRYYWHEQLISELDITGGDERKVGYYAGMIVSERLRLSERDAD